MMTPDLVCGVDPGMSGGIAILDRKGEIIGVWPMPETEHEAVEIFQEFGPRIAVVYLEKVGPMPKQGLSSTAKFMDGYGFLRGVIATLHIRRENPRPQEWQKFLGCLTGGKKAISRQKAQQLFPKCHVRITDKIADCLLIAEYGRRKGFA